jgi:hypothetical protein
MLRNIFATHLLEQDVDTPRSRCSTLKRRTFSAVAVSGGRTKKVANRPTSRM